jgi:hypothetical protein
LIYFEAALLIKERVRNIKSKHKLLLECSMRLTEIFGFEAFKSTIPFYIASIAFPFDLKKTLERADILRPKDRELFDC